MATISKHGEIGQIQRLTHKLCYCQDGHILINDGDGWRQWRKLKPGIDPVEHFRQAKAKYEDKLATKPAFREFRRLMHELVCSQFRTFVLATIKNMPGDSDGLWAESDDRCMGLSVEDCVALCFAYRAAVAESTPEPVQSAVSYNL